MNSTLSIATLNGTCANSSDIAVKNSESRVLLQ